MDGSGETVPCDDSSVERSGVESRESCASGLACLAIKSRISVSRISSFVGAGGAFGSSCFRRNRLISLITKKIRKSNNEEVQHGLQKNAMS